MNLLRQWSGRAALTLILIVIVAGLASTFPADLAFLMALDLSTCVEAAVAVYVAAQVTKIRPILSFLRARFALRRRAAARERRTRSAATRRESSSDDDPAPRLALAA